MNRTNISWLRNTDGSKGYTWNIATGCTPISAACKNCYARRLAETRLRGRCGYPDTNPFQVILHPERMTEPFAVKKPSRIFPVSMGDLFHPDVPDDFISQVFTVMLSAELHQFFVLTKRPQRMLGLCRQHPAWWSWNIWLGATIESQDYIARAECLVELARLGWHTFVSCEPCLGPINLSRHFESQHYKECPPGPNAIVDTVRDPGISFVVVGGETGPDARPMHTAWMTSLIDQCKAAGIPVHCKAMGDWWDKNHGPPEPSNLPKEFPNA